MQSVRNAKYPTQSSKLLYQLHIWQVFPLWPVSSCFPERCPRGSQRCRGSELLHEAQMTTSQTFPYILISILKMTVHLVLSVFISKNKGSKVSAAMYVFLSLQEDIFSPKIREEVSRGKMTRCKKR